MWFNFKFIIGAGCHRATGSAVPPSFPSTLRSDAASHFGATRAVPGASKAWLNFFW